jgi:hypothetical protein
MATLNVGRGFDGWSSIYAASQRLGDDDTVLYFGDFDPWGEDMMRSLRARLRNLGSRPELVKSALLFDDIERYRLPPDFTKATDTAATRRHEENERRLLIGALAGIGKE